MKKKSTKKLFQNTIEELVVMYNQGKLKNVIKKAKQLITQYPQSIFLWNILGLTNAGIKKLNEAEKISKKIIEYKKYNIEENIAYRNLILIQIYKDDYNQDLLLLKIKEFLTVFGNKEKITNKIEFKKKNKKIKIGFVSSDFRKHSINNVIHSLFINKDRLSVVSKLNVKLSETFTQYPSS